MAASERLVKRGIYNKGLRDAAVVSKVAFHLQGKRLVVNVDKVNRKGDKRFSLSASRDDDDAKISLVENNGHVVGSIHQLYKVRPADSGELLLIKASSDTLIVVAIPVMKIPVEVKLIVAVRVTVRRIKGTIKGDRFIFHVSSIEGIQDAETSKSDCAGHAAPSHHIVQRGHNRDVVFVEERDYQYYIDNLLEWKAALSLKVYSYCLMTNHIHLVVGANERLGTIGELMKRLAGRQTRFVKKMGRRTGSLWESRYKVSPIETDAYLLQCCRYVELNPVKARLTKWSVKLGLGWSSLAGEGPRWIENKSVPFFPQQFAP